MEIHPFQGWRYSPGSGSDVSTRLAPPYDVLTQADKDELLARDDKNIVAVDLPHVPPKELGPEDVYREAANLLSEWQTSGVMFQEDRPAVYAYEQTYTWAGQTYQRRAMLCGVRATPLGEDIIPHEHTFAGPKADRLKLTEMTRVQLSPIFGFYEDPQSQVANVLWTAANRRPDCQGKLRDVQERLWAVTDPGTVEEISKLLRDTPAYIADGHHRYTTAMNYAAGLRDAGVINAEHEANFVMFCLVSRDDPGLLVLPTHRIIKGLRPNFSLHAMVDQLDGWDFQRCSVEDVNLLDADAFLQKYGKHAMAFMGANPSEVWVGRLRDLAPMRDVAPEQSPAWQELDVAILHKLVLDAALAPWRTEDLFVEYTPDGRAVLAACASGRAQLGICLQGTPLESVEAVANAGGAMPHKSTYFYPKLATGMVLKPLE